MEDDKYGWSGSWRPATDLEIETAAVNILCWGGCGRLDTDDTGEVMCPECELRCQRDPKFRDEAISHDYDINWVRCDDAPSVDTDAPADMSSLAGLPDLPEPYTFATLMECIFSDERLTIADIDEKPLTLNIHGKLYPVVSYGLAEIPGTGQTFIFLSPYQCKADGELPQHPSDISDRDPQSEPQHAVCPRRARGLQCEECDRLDEQEAETDRMLS